MEIRIGRKRRYFPWQIAKRMFFNYIGFVSITAIVFGFSVRYFVYTHFQPGVDLNRSLGDFDSYLTTLFFSIMLVAGLYFVIASRWYFRPMERILRKARDIRKGIETESTLSDLEWEAPGEWYDLERALDRIRAKLLEKSGEVVRDREEMSALVSTLSDAILEIDKHGRPVFFNSPFALAFGPALGPKRDNNIRQIFRSPEVIRGFKEALTKGRSQNIKTLINTSHHSIARFYSISVTPLKDGRGEVYGAVGLFHDITELKQAEQIRIDFVGNASHELRTPLTSVKGYVETLREDLKANRLDSAEKFLDIVSRNVDRLILLLNDLLDLSAFDSGAEFTKKISSTRELTEDTLRNLEKRRAAKKIEVTTVYGAREVYADPIRVEQVLLNLISNAIQYIPEGSKVEVIWEYREPSSVCLRVRDNGPGILEEHQTRLFERFYRIDEGRSREQGGTGLGLSIVKHIVQKHGGRVSLESRVGVGSEFICVFPLTDPQ